MRELIERLEERVSDIWDIVDELEKKFGDYKLKGSAMNWKNLSIDNQGNEFPL